MCTYMKLMELARAHGSFTKLKSHNDEVNRDFILTMPKFDNMDASVMKMI